MIRHVLAAGLLVGCGSVHRPMSDTPQEVATVTGTITVGATKADVRECALRRTSSSKEGRKYGVDLVAPAGRFEIVVEDAVAAAPMLRISSDGGEARSVPLPKSACSDYVLDFYERENIVHGRVRLDCTVDGTHVVVAASVDNCE